MGSDSSQKAIEAELKDTGNRLLTPPSSVDELLILLEKAESLLSKVWQRPPMTTCRALLPIMKALITEEIMHHVDLNIQVAATSCFSEISRISAPEAPFPDDMMMVFFRLFLVAFQQLPSKPSGNYARALKILETMAKVRSVLVLLDIDNEGLIVQMFQIFFNNIRSNHPPDVSKYMEMIISLAIEESDEISFELLKPLLDSVKKDNVNTSPISFELGKRIFQNCATKVQPCLKEAMKGMNLKPDEYAEMITSLLQDAPNAENMVPDAVAQTADDGATQLDVISEGKYGDGTQVNGDDGTKVVGGTSLETLKGSEQKVKSGTDPGAPRRKRGRKPNSVIRPEEGYQQPWSVGGKYSNEVSSDSYHQRKKDLASSSKVGDKSMLIDPLEKNDSPNVVSPRKRGRPRKKETITSDQNDQEKLKKKEMELAKTKFSEKEKEKEKKPRRPRVDYGEELVNKRIQVWWPMDETYYTGTVTAYDPETKRHTILYDDDEIEVLKLRKEIWELFSDEQLYRRQEAKQPSPAVEPIETEEKNTKKKAGTSKKQTASSSKRMKGENTTVIGGWISETEEPNDETCGRSDSQKDVGGHAGKDNSDH